MIQEGKMVKVDEGKATTPEVKIEGRSVKTDSFNWTIYLSEGNLTPYTDVNFSTGEMNFISNEEFNKLWSEARKKYSEAKDNGDKKLQDVIRNIIYDDIWTKKLNGEFAKAYLKFRKEMETIYNNFEKESINELKKVLK
jgi:hypothetical protein